MFLQFVCLFLTATAMAQLYARVRLLTLRASWIWAWPAFSVLCAITTADTLDWQVSPALRSAMSFLGATMLLAPLISVLGSRRPGNRAWPWFVVLPMIVVLQWPGVSQLLSSSGRDPVQIGGPAAAGVIAVLLMGYGNYFGTRNTLAAGLISAAVILLMLPVTPGCQSFAHWHRAAPVPVCLAVLLSWRHQKSLEQLPRRSAREAGNRLWLMFRDSFGIVWSKRVLDRVNLFSDRENWPVLLTLDGFTDKVVSLEVRGKSADFGSVDRSAADPDDAFQRPLEILCWILRRFAATEWLRDHLGPFFPESELVTASALDESMRSSL